MTERGLMIDLVSYSPKNEGRAQGIETTLGSVLDV